MIGMMVAGLGLVAWSATPEVSLEVGGSGGISSHGPTGGVEAAGAVWTSPRVALRLRGAYSAGCLLTCGNVVVGDAEVVGVPGDPERVRASFAVGLGAGRVLNRSLGGGSRVEVGPMGTAEVGVLVPLDRWYLTLGLRGTAVLEGFSIIPHATGALGIRVARSFGP